VNSNDSNIGNNAGYRKEIRVFVSSPGDCDAEREAVSRVLEELNRTVGDRERLYFYAVRWEDFPPGAGNPQAVIDQQLGAYAILVGIMWMRFGTPIPRGAGSGTEHEVRQAVEAWKRVGEPRVMFYFKQDPPNDISVIDAAQLQKVQNFKRALQESALVQTFKGTSEFESKLRVHLNKLVQHLSVPDAAGSNYDSALAYEPYPGFHKAFREVVAAQCVPESGAMLHVVFGSIADICGIPVVMPVGQAFDFRQRGPASVLASFEKIRVAGRNFYDAVELLWPTDARPKAAGLGHTQYVELPENSQGLPGAFFVVTTRDLSASTRHYGIYANTPIEGVDYIIDCVIEAGKRQKVTSLALPLLGTGYANVRRTMREAQLGPLLQQAVTLLAIQRLQNAFRDQKSALRRGVIVIYSRDPQGQEEHDLWRAVTRFLGGRAEQRDEQIRQLLNAVSD